MYLYIFMLMNKCEFYQNHLFIFHVCSFYLIMFEQKGEQSFLMQIESY